jgi:phage terminase small subunit
MPNPPKPTERKRKTGNPGKRPLPAIASVITLPMAEVIPEPPRPLGPEGTKLWNRVWDNGKTWISPVSDIELVLLMCESMDERTQLRLTVLRGSDWRDRVALRSLESQLVTMISALGMNPTDRSRLGVAEVTAKGKLAQLLEQQKKNG